MRLKSILLHGFKSFHNRTEIPLAEGITAIVGPNGCGKSNVSDALRWVLGEGNVRIIRGENLLDVVFKGAGDTKPAGFAEVSLRIDNEDGTLQQQEADVSISRRVYRSGDSDFLINNLPCRLKDIRNLFLGTGLGSQGYAVIERGMVDAVLSDRDDQRRLFFEEAAGISRYKIQRKEAMRKLEATEQDLLRIDDLVQEIEREVRRLARQVGKARKHKRLLDQIRDLEVDLALLQWDELEKQHDSAASERDHGAGDRERLRGDLVRMEAEQETLKSHLLERERLLEETRAERERILTDQSTTREAIAVWTSTIQAGESRIEELSRRIAEEGERAIDLRASATQRGPERDRTAREIEEHALLFGQAQEEFGEAERRFRGAREEAARTAQIQMKHLLARTKETQELESLDASLTQLESRCASLSSHQEQIGSKVEGLVGRVGTGSEDLDRLSSRLREIEERRDDLETARQIAEAERERLRTRREDVSRAKASRASRLELLREQEARHEGFDAGVRFLLEAGDSIPGIVGVIGELVTADSSLSAAAAEAILADAVQWVVVEDEASAYAAIERLRAEGLGGVTFFPLAEMAGRAPERIEDWSDPLPISGPESIAPVVGYLLARVRPADSRETAQTMANGGSTPRAMTPEGEVHSAEGWVRWPGLSGADRAILDRLQEIPLLEERCSQMEAEEVGLSEQVTGYEVELTGLREELESLVEESKEITDRHRRREREVSEAEVERDLLLEEKERAATELQVQEERLQQRRQERESLAQRLGVSGETEREAEELHRAAQQDEEAAAKGRDEALECLSGRRTEAVRLDNGLREIEAAILREEQEADRLEGAIGRWTEERDEADRLCAEARSDREAAMEKATSLEALQVEKAHAVDRRRSERDEKQTELAAHEQKLREVRSELQGLQERLHSDEMRQLELRSQMDRIRQRIRQEFQIDLEEVAGRRREESEKQSQDEQAEPPDEESSRRQIVDLREKLAKVGPVNFLAAEEYDEQKERLVFHRKQRDDLQKARQDLLDAISQINQTAGRMFLETFEQARVHFRETFESLFPGGEANLVLVGEDPLEGSIEISARPRGKKLEAIRLLSTGERSLTAIALLFGIYLVKPSPFCILDEIDAPLDDANIGRFVGLLRHFSARTQFVVITHNKRTMEAADRLYGVTMPTVGISQIVSVRLSDADLALTPAAAELLHAGQEEGEEA